MPIRTRGIGGRADQHDADELVAKHLPQCTQRCCDAWVLRFNRFDRCHEVVYHEAGLDHALTHALNASAVAVGLSVREPWFPALRRLPRKRLDVLEVIVERVAGSKRWASAYAALARKWPIVAHGVELGIGDAGGLDPQHLVRVAEICRALDARWFGEHLAFLNKDGVPLGHFGPLDADDETLATLMQNAAEVRRVTGRPLLLENPADILGFGATGPDAGARLGANFARALDACEAGALLDVTNLLYNARNDGYDPMSFLEALPMERVVQVHLAGGRRVHGLWIDSHESEVEEESLELLMAVAQRAPQLRAVVVEWDEELPALEVALDVVERARRALVLAGRR